ncbi:hypothetical protein CYMTET_29023 [Cymbomonas tetramitiformis]|uniref:Uncharacterized protein n=1 Tax=Cymbomonas tetramitiformis TaxID=36881 RepID=A0AAE0FLT2_9CHLO|nr:hypothetical protein CYMTET_29023 [Cymbomonas tetramitiformis]
MISGSLPVLRVTRVQNQFHTIAVDRCSLSRNQIVLYAGCIDGRIRVYALNLGTPTSLEDQDLLSEESSLHTKGGAAIKALCVRAAVGGQVEIVAADTLGQLTIFNRQQIVWRGSSLGAVTTLTAYEDATGCVSYVSGDVTGTIMSFSQWDRLPEWRAGRRLRLEAWEGRGQLRLVDNVMDVPQCPAVVQLGEGVRAVASALFPDGAGSAQALLAVCSDRKCLLLYSADQLVQAVPLPATCTCLCIGCFTHSAQSRGLLQVALGGVDGHIYVVTPTLAAEASEVVGVLGTSSQCITQITACPSVGKLDAVVCAGHFSGVRMFRGNEMVAHGDAPDWVHCLVYYEYSAKQVDTGCDTSTAEGILLAGTSQNRVIMYDIGIF